MILWIKILILTTLLSSCSHAGMYPVDVNNHIKTFEAKCNCKISVPIYFKPIENSTAVGICYGFRQLFVFQYIVIDSNYWDTADQYDQESLLFHEIGHCVYGLDHDDSTYSFLEDYRPKSIMHPYTFYQYKYYRDEYIQELFTRIETKSKEDTSVFSFFE
jgi:hypothetical protein